MRQRLLLLLLLLLLPVAALGEVRINEVMASNGTYEGGHAYDWVELVNTGSQTADLGGWYLSDSKKNPLKWQLPEGAKLKKGGYLTVFCTGDAGHEAGGGDTFYAPFKISSSGDTLYLSDDSGTLVQELELPPQYGNISWGLAAGTEDTWGFFEEATRGKKNSQTVYDVRTAAPLITTAGGFYDGSVTVQAEGPSGATLRYTLDGDEPTAKSKKFPAGGLKVKKTAAVRVRAFAEGEVPSPTVSTSYFIGDTLVTPVVSLITNDSYLFGSKRGALSKGKGSVPNYDKDYEYPVNIEYYTAEGVCEINQVGTFTCTGHSAAGNGQKSIGLYARSAWGPGRFEFNPFPNRPYGSYKSILLRAANSDWHATRLRDIVASSLAAGEGIAFQDYQIIQVYINGKYWGHYNLREKINKYFVAQWEGITDEETIDAIDLLERTGSDQFTQNGDNTDWLALCDFCKKTDLNDPEALAWVEERIDIDSLFTHAAYEIILGNVDFTNVRVYRVPGGKWKYILFDVEACWRGLDKTPLEYYIKPVTGKIQGFRHEPLNALLAVPEMKVRFLNRVAELLETHFQWPQVKAAFDPVVETLEKILPRHVKRWTSMKLSDWRTNVSATKYYARVRPRRIPELLQAAMKLTDAEVETYFGDVLRLLEETNAKE